MPSVYAHERFGGQVLEQLPAPIRSLAEKYRRQFGIGLQGPDFLFFYRAWKPNPISALGQQIHRASAAELFYSFRETLKDAGVNSMETACALGTICHFMLDSSCHWYVNQQIQETGIGHNEVETEFERYLMAKDGLDPLRFKIWEMIPNDKETAACLARLYDYGIVEPRVALRCLKDMRMVKKTLMAPGPAKQKLFRTLMRMSGHYDEIQGHLMKLSPNSLCDRSNRQLEELSDGAVEETAALITEYYQNLKTGKPLNERFNRNFE